MKKKVLKGERFYVWKGFQLEIKEKQEIKKKSFNWIFK